MLPAASAFGASGTVNATASWRNVSSQELADFNPFHDSATDILGNQTSSDSNFANASNVTTGWLPDGSTLTQPNSSDFQSIVLDLPIVDLGCSSDVQIEVTSGIAELLNTSTGLNAELGWMVVNNFNKPLFEDNGYVENQVSTNAVPGSYDLTGSQNINPQSAGFGMKLVIGLQTWQNANTNQWNVHDLAVQYTYDDEGGTCAPATATAATTCTDDYFGSVGLDVSDPDLVAIQNIVGSSDIENVDGDPSLIHSVGGLPINSALNDTSTFRVMELSFNPQTPLLSAGSLQFLVDFDFVPDTFGTVLYTMIGNMDTVYLWQSFDASFQGGTASTYLQSADLSEVHVYFLVQTSSGPDQLASNLSNVSIRVRHLQDVSVCGLSLLNSSTPDPGSNAGANGSAGNVGSAAGTLPSTGTSTVFLFLASLIFISLGFGLTTFSRRQKAALLESACGYKLP